MQFVHIGSGPVHEAPMPNGPQVEVLIGEDGAVAAVHALLPPGGVLPEHDHGESEALVTVWEGHVEITAGGQQETLESGAVALIGVGERVSLRNPTADPASLLVCLAPPAFVRVLSAWPLRPDTA